MYVKALLVYDGVEGVFGVTVKMRGGSGASKKSSSDGEPEIGVSVENFEALKKRFLNGYSLFVKEYREVRQFCLHL